MPDEMRVETMELCVTACEKFATNNEVSLECALSLYFYLVVFRDVTIPISHNKIIPQ